MEQIKLEDVISNLELNIRWIEDIPAHQFAGYGNVVMAMRDALELLKKQEPVEPIYTTRELAVECWNTRPPLAVLDEASVGAKLNWKKLTKKTMPPVGANVILWCDLNTGAPIAVVAHVWPDGVLRFWNFHGSEELTPDQYRRTRWAEIPAPAEERYGKDR